MHMDTQIPKTITFKMHEDKQIETGIRCILPLVLSAAAIWWILKEKDQWPVLLMIFVILLVLFQTAVIFYSVGSIFFSRLTLSKDGLVYQAAFPVRRLASWQETKGFLVSNEEVYLKIEPSNGKRPFEIPLSWFTRVQLDKGTYTADGVMKSLLAFAPHLFTGQLSERGFFDQETGEMQTLLAYPSQKWETDSLISKRSFDQNVLFSILYAYIPPVFVLNISLLFKLPLSAVAVLIMFVLLSLEYRGRWKNISETVWYRIKTPADKTIFVLCVFISMFLVSLPDYLNSLYPFSSAVLMVSYVIVIVLALLVSAGIIRFFGSSDLRKILNSSL